ncbi:MAG TPA: phage recombination protein Bet [Streptosporangiaceae bacterium]|jgi:phage recombination protein Bet
MTDTTVMDAPAATAAGAAPQGAAPAGELAELDTAALAIRPDQTMWTPYQRAALAQMGVAQDCPNPVLATFLHTCQTRRLDPFIRQVYLIGRPNKRKGTTEYTAQTGIDGFRVIARRAADKAGIEYGYEDPVWFDRNGREHAVWLADGPPAAARCVVLRNGHRFAAVARFDAYAARWQPSGDLKNQWATMPDHMILKCAEALALRMAFPEDLGGLYTDEEMQQADNGFEPPAGAPVVTGRAEPAAAPPNPAPTAAASPEQPADPGDAVAAGVAQQFAAEAQNAPDLDTWRDIYRRAVAAGVLREPVTVGGKAGPLGVYLTARGLQLQAAARTTTTEQAGDHAA